MHLQAGTLDGSIPMIMTFHGSSGDLFRQKSGVVFLGHWRRQQKRDASHANNQNECIQCLWHRSRTTGSHIYTGHDGKRAAHDIQREAGFLERLFYRNPTLGPQWDDTLKLA